MGIVIVGAGSIGLLLASYLAEAGLEVTLYVRSNEQKDSINRYGIRRINEDGTESTFIVNATTESALFETAQLLVIAVKYAHLHPLLEQMAKEKIKTPLLFVQNGLAHLDLVRNHGFPTTAFATVEHGALKIDQYTVRHNGVGQITIGVGNGDSHAFDVIEQAHKKKFPVKRHADAELILMRKVMINCLVNPLTAILGVKNGELLTNHYCNDLFLALYRELLAAFPIMATELPLRSVEEVCRKTANNQSSMLVDRLAGRPMEIETIVTAVIKKASTVKKELPLLGLLEKMLYALDEKGVL